MNGGKVLKLWICFQELGDEPSLTFRTAILITFSFLYLFVASGMLGAAFGLTAALLLKASPSIHVHQVSIPSPAARLCHDSQQYLCSSSTHLAVVLVTVAAWPMYCIHAHESVY